MKEQEEKKEPLTTADAPLTTSEKFALLREPFELRWRVQSSKGGKYADIVPYVDARAVQQRFDDVFGPENWQNCYEQETGTASISIRVDGEWISKSDIGTDSNVEKEKGKASDAFKRAAVLWGANRSVYAIGTKKLPWNEQYKCPTTPKGDLLNTPVKLSLYMNGLNTSMGLLVQLWNENKELQADEKFKKLMNYLREYVK